jgi:hypothetical protein
MILSGGSGIWQVAFGTARPSNFGVPTTSDGTDLYFRDLTTPTAMRVIDKITPINAPTTIPPIAPFDNEWQLPMEFVIVEVINTTFRALLVVILMVAEGDVEVELEVGPWTAAGTENLLN